MGEFTYTVFVVVASLAGALVTLFAAGVIGVLLQDADTPRDTARTAAQPPVDYRHAA